MLGVLVLHDASADTLGVMLGFGAVALLFLVTEELLNEAHEIAETSLAMALLPLGFLIYLVISEAIG